MSKHNIVLTKNEVNALNEFFNFGSNLADDSEVFKNVSLKQERKALAVWIALKDADFSSVSERIFEFGKVELRWYVKYLEYGNDCFEPGDFSGYRGIDTPEQEEQLINNYNSGIKKLWNVLNN